jgi:VCBS repeat protein
VTSRWSLLAVASLVGLLLPPPSRAQQRATPNPIQFAPPIVFGYPGSYPGAIASGEFTNDGFQDLIVGAEYGDVAVKLGRGDGTFGHWRNAFSPSHSASSLALGKFDGKNLDAVVNDISDAWVLLGGGGGGFPRTTWLNAGGNFVVGFAVGDFNHDGKQDIAALVNIPGQNSDSSEIYLYLGSGDGTFQSARSFSVGEQVPMAILAGDFNGDGKLDLAVLCTHQGDFAGQAVVLLGDGKGGFRRPIRFGLSNNPPYLPYAMTLADFNHDDKLDLAVAYENWDSNSSSFARILLGNGDGTFHEGVRATAGSNPVSIAAADFNGDGIPDLVVANSPCYKACDYLSSISVLLGNGDGTFQPPAKFPVHGQTSLQLTVADFNGDGKPDVATVNVNTQNVSVLLNTTQFPALNAKPPRTRPH